MSMLELKKKVKKAFARPEEKLRMELEDTVKVTNDTIIKFETAEINRKRLEETLEKSLNSLDKQRVLALKLGDRKTWEDVKTFQGVISEFFKACKSMGTDIQRMLNLTYFIRRFNELYVNYKDVVRSFEEAVRSFSLISTVASGKEVHRISGEAAGMMRNVLTSMKTFNINYIPVTTFLHEPLTDEERRMEFEEERRKLFEKEGKSQ
jgi:hypothetical protein